MSQVASGAPTGPVWRTRLELLQREVVVGVPAALTMLAASLAGGVLVCGALGPDYVAFGAAAGFSGALFGGASACLIATNSMILWGPLVTIGLVQASLVATLVANPLFANNPTAVVIALVACTGLAGVLQIASSFGGMTRLVKFTPYPVIAGFINGVSASIFVSQVKVFLPSHWKDVTAGTIVVHPAMLLFVVALVAFNFWFSPRTKRIPAQLMSLIAGVAIYHAMHIVAPRIDLGPTLGPLPFQFPPGPPIQGLSLPEAEQFLLAAASDIILFAVATVVVGSFQSLLAFRMAEGMLNAPIAPDRGLVALGVGDIVSAATGGLAISVAAPMTVAAFRSGGRTRIVGLTVSIVLLLLILLLPNLLSAIPLAVIIALLFIVSISAFDRWSVRLLGDVLRGSAHGEGRRTHYDLAVVAIIMAVTLLVSIVPAILAGFAVACITFAMNMSRPVVRRRLAGLRSKHVRAAAESALLRQNGERWVVLRLSGVLFFGNCETLSQEVIDAFRNADVIVLDCRNVTDIDASGANIIQELVDKSRKLEKRILFCNVQASFRNIINRIANNGSAASIFDDLDSALEWIEDTVLNDHPEVQLKTAPLNLEQHDFMRGLNDTERAALASLLTRREFPQGCMLAKEGEPGDRMWLIMKGCVNILLRVDDPPGGRRVASSGCGDYGRRNGAGGKCQPVSEHRRCRECRVLGTGPQRLRPDHARISRNRHEAFDEPDRRNGAPNPQYDRAAS